MQRTRRQIVDILKKQGQANLEGLARATELSPVTVRAHLAVLERDDFVVSQEVRGKVGRPFYVYSLGPQAEELFPRSYDVLANAILDELAVLDGASSIAGLLERIALRRGTNNAQRVAGMNLEGRVAEVARLRSEEGAFAEWEKDAHGYVLHQYHCPSRRVAEKHQALCQAELLYLRTLLDAEVNLIHCQMDGDRTCTYRVTDRQ